MSLVAHSHKRNHDEMSPNHPFGFDLGQYMAPIKQEYHLGVKTHHLDNCITGFKKGQPIFENPTRTFTVMKTDGLMATFKGRDRRELVSEFHTSHTVSLFAMAHRIKSRLLKAGGVHLQEAAASEFKQVDLRHAKHQLRHSKTDIVWLNATHLSKAVVLKTTTDPLTMLRYILEAVIHHRLATVCPESFPTLYFVGFEKRKRLVVCSEQLPTVSVTRFVRELSPNDDHAMWRMARQVCCTVLKVQQQLRFTHRDCHTSNVYYDKQTDTVKFIDFDWSSLQWGGAKISVPQYLYDTTRPTYCRNRSVDLCIFWRTLGPTLDRAPRFRNHIYKPLMKRYEEESRRFLRNQSARDTAAMHLYKTSSSDQSMRGHYAHRFGLKKNPVNFEYKMAYYEWACMTPNSILQFMADHPLE
jgi:hypothetical protein